MKSLRESSGGGMRVASSSRETLSARESWKACHRANRRWKYTCWHCGGHCAAHHSLYLVQGYDEHTIEYACPCGGFTLYDTADTVSVGERGVW